MAVKFKENDSVVKVREAPELVRGGGEARPFEYPHLYQIQAGEWRISYAVEQNHLAILVLEVLNPDGSVRKDPARETLTRKMKVKLLDWPEGKSHDLPPEELGKRVKIKLLDLADELNEEHGRERPSDGKVHFLGGGSKKTAPRRITLLDGKVKEPATAAAKPAASAETEDEDGRKVTPLDSPTM